MDDLLATLAKVWPYVLALGAAISWIVQIVVTARKEKRAAATAERQQEIDAERLHAELFGIAQKAVASANEELRTELNRQKGENADLRQRVDHLEGELAAVRKTHIDMVEAKDATITLLSGRVSALEAENEALRRMLRKAGVEPPPTMPAHFEVPPTPIKPATEPLP